MKARVVSVAFRCPHCGHGFQRLTGKITGSTSCPKCLRRFSRADGQVLGDEATKVRRENLERKLKKNQSIYSPKKGDAQLIRGDQVPLSAAEAKFKARAVDKGWRPHRPSWPDFLVETENGVIAVEVKSRTDDVSASQRATFTLLESAGIPVYLWKDRSDVRANLIRWAKGAALRKLAPTV